MKLFGRNLGVLVKRTVNHTLSDNLFGLSAEAAYNFFFGVFPLLLFAAPLLGLFGNRQQIFDTLLVRLGPHIPTDALTLVERVLRDIVFAKNAPGLVSIGAIFAAAFWIIFTYAFRLYVEHFGSYNKTYGTIGAVIVLLTWMYWTMFAVLVGGELNAELHVPENEPPPEPLPVQ